jgi:ribose transport system substrate-binding protein
MKKRLFAMAIAGIMAMSLTACSGGSGEEANTDSPATEDGSAEDGSAASGESLEIGLAFPLLDEGMSALSDAIIHFLEENEQGIEITTTLTNADSDINKLIDDVESLIAKDPDCIYIMNSIGDTGVIPAVQACVDAGIPVGVGVSIEGYNEYDFLYEGFSQYACGQMQAEYMESIYDENAQYNCAVITGDAGNPSGADRSNGFIENFIDKHDNAELVIMGEGNFNTDDAQALAEDWLIAHPEINLIACANDDEAQGVVNAVKAANADVIVLGIDATDLGKSLIESGDMDCTVQIDFGGVAKSAAENIIKCAQGGFEGTGNEVKLTTENLKLVTAETLAAEQ